MMQRWQQDPDLAGVRGPDALRLLPDSEHREWQQLWAEVDGLCRSSSGPP
jgi:hypothetical protein